MIKFATSKELRVRAGEIIKEVQGGERFIVTYRGKPAAIMLPYAGESIQDIVPRSYEDAWADIEKTINETEAAYLTADEAVGKSRKRR